MSGIKNWSEKNWTEVLEELELVLGTSSPNVIAAERQRAYAEEGVRELAHRWRMIREHLEELGMGYIRDLPL